MDSRPGGALLCPGGSYVQEQKTQPINMRTAQLTQNIF